MLDKVRAWEGKFLRLTCRARMHTGESWVNDRQRTPYQLRIKWKKMYLPLLVEKIVDKIWMTSGLHLPQGETSPGEQEEVDMASFGDAGVALTVYQVVQLYQADSTRGYPEFNDDGGSVSSGGMSFDLGEMWRCGCPTKPRLAQ